MRTSDPAGDRGGPGASIAARLLAAANELRDLEQLIKTADFDSRVLRDFRGAVDNVRTTTWATQQWIERREHGADPYGVLPVLSAERCATRQRTRERFSPRPANR